MRQLDLSVAVGVAVREYPTDLHRMVQFAEAFPDEQIVATLWRQLSWSHFRELLPLKRFLLELGAGFSFVARQRRIQLDSDDFYIDLLFYNRKLRRLVAVELKLGDFRAEYKGQMELYLPLAGPARPGAG